MCRLVEHKDLDALVYDERNVAKKRNYFYSVLATAELIWEGREIQEQQVGQVLCRAFEN